MGDLVLQISALQHLEFDIPTSYRLYNATVTFKVTFNGAQIHSVVGTLDVINRKAHFNFANAYSYVISGYAEWKLFLKENGETYDYVIDNGVVLWR